MDRFKKMMKSTSKVCHRDGRGRRGKCWEKQGKPSSSSSSSSPYRWAAPMYMINFFKVLRLQIIAKDSQDWEK